jgi:hypothetical protein
MLKMALGSNLDFVAKSVGEHIEARVEKGKVEFHGWMQQAIQRAGLSALTAPIELPLEIEDKTEKE